MVFFSPTQGRVQLPPPVKGPGGAAKGFPCFPCLTDTRNQGSFLFYQVKRTIRFPFLLSRTSSTQEEAIWRFFKCFSFFRADPRSKARFFRSKKTPPQLSFSQRQRFPKGNMTFLLPHLVCPFPKAFALRYRERRFSFQGGRPFPFGLRQRHALIPCFRSSSNF